MLSLFPALLLTFAITFIEVKATDAHTDEFKPRRQLHGRFLHITDMHPDQHYSVDASVSSHCHRNAPRKERVRAGYFGVPYDECDSPWALTNLTLDYLEKEWAHNIDFVIWTGDNARHDNDNRLPRTPAEIFEHNRIVAVRMGDVFKEVPVVPSIGNNDIWPHNIMTPGPNSITNEFSDIWRAFIPFSQYQVFQHGGYFAIEVIPDQVAAISLNTMYWYDSNKAVGGCVPHDMNDAGNMEFDWLEVQLDRFRERGMQVILSGHVPPGPGLYFPDCYFRYGQISLRFQDTIIAHLYGHMNIDHFFWVDVEDVMKEPSETSASIHTRAKEFEALYQREELHNTLHKDFQYLNERRKIHFNDYAVMNVGPSVIPEYLPSFRIFQYNTTGYEGPFSLPSHAYRAVTTKVGSEREHEEKRKKGSKRKHGHRHPQKPDCSKKQNKDRWACRPWGPRHASPESPSRSNRLWSLLGYAQYYLPDQATGNATHPPKYKLEYLTFPVDALHPPNDTTLAKKWKPPVPRHLLPRSLRNVSRTRSRFAPYRMKDLTIPRWIKLARKLAERDRLWNKFVSYMYMGEDDEETHKVGYDDEDVEVEDGQEEEDEEEGEDEDGEDEDEDADEDEWQIPQERQWPLLTRLPKDEDDVSP